MNYTRTILKSTLLCILVLALTAGSLQAQSKKPITIDDFGMFESIRGQKLSDNGEWIAYEVRPGEGDGKLVVVNVNSGTTYEIERGSSPLFTDDSRWVGYKILTPFKSGKDKRAEKKEKKKVSKEFAELGFINLATGEKTVIDDVKGFKFSDDSKWIACLLEKPEEDKKKKEGEETAEKEEKEDKKKDKKKTGSGLVLRNLSSGTEENFEFVTEYGFTDDSKYFFFAVSTEDGAGDGLFFREIGKTSPVAAIMEGKGKYEKLTLNEDGNEMVFLSDRDDQSADSPAFSLYLWKAGDTDAQTLVGSSAVPTGKVLHDRDLAFSEDGKSVYFNLDDVQKPEIDYDTGDLNPDLYIWHWKDVELVPQQQKRYTGKTTGSHHTRNEWRWSSVDSLYQAVYHFDTGNFVRLEDILTRQTDISPDNRYAVGMDFAEANEELPWRPIYSDYYLVDLKTGAWELIGAKEEWDYEWSNDGNYLLQYAEPDWFVYDVSTGEKRNLTADLGVEFWDTDDDHPDRKRSWGMAGWTKDDEAVILYDKFDLWYFPVKKGSPENLTKSYGRDNNIRLRYFRADPEEEFIDIKKPLMLRAFNNRTKAAGMFEVKKGKTPVELTMLDKGVGRSVVKAKNADVFMFNLSTFNQFGNIWTSDAKFKNMKQITDVNPDNNGFLWGTNRLIDYRNMNGVPLQALLHLPENYVEGQKYPMIIYYYEKLTQTLHTYRAPRTGSGFAASEFTSNGYVVLIPDIIYTDGFPGPSSVKCVVPAAQKVIDMGIADEKRIAITGHSWGGYQTSYIITQTDMFACAYAGAPVANMTSAYGGIRWGSGNPRTFQYERTQSRIGGTLWEYPERYIENSPLFFVDRIETPLLILHGDKDGAVPWYQSIEFMLALRRLAKPAWFLQYGGEAHGLRDEANRYDFTIRRMQFFDHYLKDKPMPKWMAESSSIFDDKRKK